MNSDEQAIRDLVKRWMDASKAGDLATALSLMADDVVFMVPGKEPFGKEAFVAGSKAMAGIEIDGHSEIVELQILGDWAWMRNRLRIALTASGAKPIACSGFTRTILKKLGDGRWVIARDANLLAPQSIES
jgi:uncharacterized protein (TIGR02246 family)